MKRILSLLLCLTCLFCTTACVGVGSHLTTPPETTPPETTPTDTGTTTASVTVLFVWKDGFSSVEVPYGGIPTAPTVEGYETDTHTYTFTGWDQTLRPAYTGTTYTAVYRSESKPGATMTNVGVGPWESISSEVSRLNPALRSFKMELTDACYGDFDVKCRTYMEGPDAIDSGSPMIDQFVYSRNEALRESLGVSVTYTYTSRAWGTATSYIQSQTDDAANPDAADLYVYPMYDMVLSCFNSSFRELGSIDGSYFDFETWGWYGDVMRDLSLDREKLYVMVSDYFSETYRNFEVLPINLTMIDESTSELGSLLLPAGETLKQGEVLSDYLFRLVLDGKWTWDTLTALCEAIYIDNNGDGVEDSGDRVGIYMDSYGGDMATAALYSTRLTCLADGVGAVGTALEGKLVPTYSATGDALNGVFLAIGKLLQAQGSLCFSSNSVSPSALFKEGLSLTAGPARLGELEGEHYLTMRDAYSVLPLPMLKAGTAADYTVPINSTAAIGAFNIHSTKYLAMSAYVQLATDTDAVKEAYMNSIRSYNIGAYRYETGEMLELICNSSHSVREMILDEVLRNRKNETVFNPAGLGDVRWRAMLKASDWSMALSAKDGAFLSKYLTVVDAKQRGMNELMEEWYALSYSK